MNTGPDQQRVSDAYRDIARETSPSHLDDRIMNMARQQARTPYGQARAWVRPVAWAATIALSFAFILELTYFREDPLPTDSAVLPATGTEADRGAEPDPRDAAFKPAPASIVAAPEIRTRDARADEAIDHCHAEARQTPASWYRCVLDLRDRGLHDAANAELAALRETFPDFREPVSE